MTTNAPCQLARIKQAAAIVPATGAWPDDRSQAKRYAATRGQILIAARERKKYINISSKNPKKQ